ncbi:MAG: VWA domain-containing protein [Acidobacteria bacterium]|nr:VWA domain-containing protein [Acidobacteriota bacterium]
MNTGARGKPRWLAAALLLVVSASSLWLRSESPPPATVEPLRVEVVVVDIYCTVKDKNGRLVTNLEGGDFEVFEDERPQRIRYFSRQTDRPLLLALLLDTSISQREVLSVEKDATVSFLEQILRPVDRALLMSFDLHVNVLQSFTAERARLRQGVERARIYPEPAPESNRDPRLGGTRLYDALYQVIHENLDGKEGRKAIILISDGVDAGSAATQEQVVRAAQRADVIIYPVRVADPGFYWRLAKRPSEGDAVLRKLAAETGGKPVFTSSASKLEQAFDQISAELRNQYWIGYQPTNRRRDGGFRKVEVKVDRHGLQVQARRGYYAASR